MRTVAWQFFLYVLAFLAIGCAAILAAGALAGRAGAEPVPVVVVCQLTTTSSERVEPARVLLVRTNSYATCYKLAAAQRNTQGYPTAYRWPDDSAKLVPLCGADLADCPER